jgi:preprotein translocase subunit SecY
MKLIDRIKNWKFIKTLTNIYNIEDLRNRILITFLFVLIYRFGSFVVLPGIDPASLAALSENMGEQTESGIMALLDMFSGGAFSNASIFALGIMPYISASIVMQLLTIAVPALQKKQQDESGHKKIQQYTRYVTVLILLLQAPSYLVNLTTRMESQQIPVPEGWWFIISSMIILCAGSMFVMWLGERITDRGVGNGISFIILVGIIARFPGAISQEFATCLEDQGGGGLVKFLIEIIMLFVVSCAAILLVQGVRKIPVYYAKRVENGKQYGGVRNYIPLKVNAAGVMPIIFAQAIMFVPVMILSPGVLSDGAETSFFYKSFTDMNGRLYNLVIAILIIVFTYLYTAITINPTKIADNLKKNNGFIPQKNPGSETAEYLDTIMSRLTAPGSICLAIIAILPAIAAKFDVTAQFAQFFGGTSLLIIVGVCLDTLQQVESHLLMNHYDGLMESGRIQGRSGLSAY